MTLRLNLEIKEIVQSYRYELLEDQLYRNKNGPDLYFDDLKRSYFHPIWRMAVLRQLL